MIYPVYFCKETAFFSYILKFCDFVYIFFKDILGVRMRVRHKRAHMSEASQEYLIFIKSYKSLHRQRIPSNYFNGEFKIKGMNSFAYQRLYKERLACAMNATLITRRRFKHTLARNATLLGVSVSEVRAKVRRVCVRVALGALGCRAGVCFCFCALRLRGA